MAIAANQMEKSSTRHSLLLLQLVSFLPLLTVMTSLKFRLRRGIHKLMRKW